MGLVVLFFLLIYLALLAAATAWCYRFGKKRGWPLRKRWSAAALGFLIIFLPVFWDWLPTVWLHSYYCEKYGGLTVNTTPEQWKKENPSAVETLVYQELSPQVGHGDKYYLQLNQRFRWEVEQTTMPLWLWHREDRIVDSNTGKVMVRYEDFTSGQRREGKDLRDFKVWMYRGPCEPEGKMVSRKNFHEFSEAFKTMGVQR